MSSCGQSARLASLGTNRQAARNYRPFAELLLSTPARPKVLVLGGARLGAGLEAIVDIASIEFVESDVYLGPRTTGVPWPIRSRPGWRTSVATTQKCPGGPDGTVAGA